MMGRAGQKNKSQKTISGKGPRMQGLQGCKVSRLEVGGWRLEIVGCGLRGRTADRDT